MFRGPNDGARVLSGGRRAHVRTARTSCMPHPGATRCRQASGLGPVFRGPAPAPWAPPSMRGAGSQQHGGRGWGEWRARGSRASRVTRSSPAPPPGQYVTKAAVNPPVRAATSEGAGGATMSSTGSRALLRLLQRVPLTGGGLNIRAPDCGWQRAAPGSDLSEARLRGTRAALPASDRALRHCVWRACLNAAAHERPWPGGQALARPSSARRAFPGSSSTTSLRIATARPPSSVAGCARGH